MIYKYNKKSYNFSNPEKGGNTIMRVLLIKILVVILLQIVIILIQEFWK